MIVHLTVSCNFHNFFLEYAGELHIIALREGKKAKIATRYTHHTPKGFIRLHTRPGEIIGGDHH
jgi:hypothetical protein